MKKILFIISALVGTSLLVSSCVKNADNFTDFRDINPILELKTGVSVGGGADLINIAGLANFGNSALSVIPSYFEDTISWYVNLASENTLTKNVSVTVGIQPELITSYNADTTHLQYELMPDSDYVWSGDVNVTIPAGERTALITGLQFNFDKIDPTKNYMLPIGIKSGDGLIVSANQGAIYFHAIGNPLAGAYLWNWHRWNAADSTTVPKTTSSFDGEGTNFSPINPTTIEVPTGYYIQPRYVLTFTNAGGVLSNLRVTFNDDDVATVNAGGVTLSDVTIITADFVNRHFKFQYVATTGSGPRYITDEYYVE